MTIATAPYLEQRFKQVATQSRDPKSPCMPQPKSRSMIAIAFVLPVVFDKLWELVSPQLHIISRLIHRAPRSAPTGWRRVRSTRWIWPLPLPWKFPGLI